MLGGGGGTDTPPHHRPPPPQMPSSEKVQQEIERVMGRERSPSLQDQGAMPYTEAVLHETLRFLDLIPLGFIRRAKRDTQLGGFIIPKVLLIRRG